MALVMEDGYYDYDSVQVTKYENIHGRRDLNLPAGEDNRSHMAEPLNVTVYGDLNDLQENGGDKLPLFYFHGGPGAGFAPNDHRFYDPDKYVVIMVVQRGSQGANQYIETEEDAAQITTQHIEQDMNDVMDALGIKSAVISGGSWGSTLAMKFAQDYPERIQALILRGVYV